MKKVELPVRFAAAGNAMLVAAVGTAVFRAVAEVVVLATTLSTTAPARLLADPMSWTWPWVQFDARWYVAIAEIGYVRLSPVLGGTIPPGSDVRLYGSGLYAYDGVAFPPLYPALMRSVSWLAGLHPALAGMLIGTVALFAALVAVHRLAEADHGAAVARMSVVILLVFPSALFLAAPYAEPLLLMSLAWAFWCARRGRWWVAGLFLAAAALTKVYAVVFILAVAFEAFDGGSRAPSWRRVLAIALPPALALLAWMGYLQARFGDPMRFLTVQKYWHHQFAAPWTSLAYTFETIYNDGRALELASLALLAVMTVYAFRRLRRSYAVAMLVALLAYTTTSNIVSVNRFVIALFPLFIALGVAATRHLWVRVATATTCLPLSVFLLVGFVHGHWAG